MGQVVRLHLTQVAGLAGDGCLGEAGAARPLAHVEVLLELLEHYLRSAHAPQLMLGCMPTVPSHISLDLRLEQK